MWPNPTPIHKALQAGKCCDDNKDIICLKLCNVNKHNYISHFMEIQQRANQMQPAYVHHFKTEANRCDFNSYTAAIHIFGKGLRDTHNITVKIYEKDP